jgi:hypothetical protein
MDNVMMPCKDANCQKLIERFGVMIVDYVYV